MVTLAALWLPILVSALFVFVASALIHMLLGYHAGDLEKLPDEERIGQALREGDVPPGEYVIPHCEKDDWNTPELAEKMHRGPVATIRVRPSRPVAMGPMLAQWFVFCLIVSVFAAYVAGRALPPGGEYLEIFRFTGTVAFVGHVLATWGDAVWFGRRGSTLFKYTLDALIYALLTGGVFGWLWPG